MIDDDGPVCGTRGHSTLASGDNGQGVPRESRLSLEPLSPPPGAMMGN